MFLVFTVAMQVAKCWCTVYVSNTKFKIGGSTALSASMTKLFKHIGSFLLLFGPSF